MRNRTTFLLLFFLLTALAANVVSCSRFSRPSDEEVLKAINDSGILNGKAFTVTSPLTIVERGDRHKDGAWPIKVKMTLSFQKPDGTMVENKENVVTFLTYKSSDGAGKTIWRATIS